MPSTAILYGFVGLTLSAGWYFTIDHLVGVHELSVCLHKDQDCAHITYMIPTVFVTAIIAISGISVLGEWLDLLQIDLDETE